MDQEFRAIPEGERVIVGGDLNGHVGISREAIERIQGGWEVGVAWESVGRLSIGYRVAGKWESRGDQ